MARRVTHSLGRDGLHCMITLLADGPVFLLQRQAGVRTPLQTIQLTAQQIRDMAAIVAQAGDERA